MDILEITDSLDGHKGQFTAWFLGREAGLMTFSMAGDDKFIIDHTEVNEAFNGKGFGRKLVAHAVEYARGNNLKIIPLCPYAKGVFQRTPEYADVLA